MLPCSPLKYTKRKGSAMSLAPALFLFIPVGVQAQAPSTPAPSTHTSVDGQPRQSAGTPSVPASQQPPSRGPQHPPETYQGRTPHGSGNGPAIAGAIGGAAVAGGVIAEIIAHHNSSPEKFGHDGPEVPKDFDMNGFAVKGLVGPNWPVVLDFMVDSPGRVQLDIVAADNKHHYRATMTNSANHRAYAIIRLPADFGTKTQVAAYQILSIPVAGSNAPPPQLRTYGLGAGEKAVGSVAIDQLNFQPAIIHPQAKEVANYSFHAHSAFDGVNAEFIFTTLYNGHVLVEKDQEEKLSPIPEGEQARGTWAGKGKPGEHLLEVRAWRGLENGGDWVVAWSPDIVDVVK
jgi:hypothetical protein